MKVKYELISEEITYAIAGKIRDCIMHDGLKGLGVDLNEVVDTTAITALTEIQEIVKNNELSDFDAMEQIVCVFEKYKIGAGGRHDF